MKNVLSLNNALSREDVESIRQRMTELCHYWAFKRGGLVGGGGEGLGHEKLCE